MSWDENAEKMLGKEITDILDENDISVASVEHEKDTLNVEMEYYSDAGEDFIFNVSCEDKEEFTAAFREYAEEFDAEEHAEEYVEVRGTNGVPESIATLLGDANSIKEHLKDVADRLEGNEPAKDIPSVQITLDENEINKLMALGILDDFTDKEQITNALHEIIDEIPEHNLEKATKPDKKQNKNEYEER